jgi:nucleoside-diphosphate-sugar epimerase
VTRAVILGARGFIAAELARHLRERSLPVEPVGSDTVNLLDGGAAGALAARLRATDSLVFTAALTPEHGRDAATFEKNLLMARNVCTALDQKPVAHLLYVSSDAALANGGPVLDEDSPRVAGGALYGRMHAERERMMESVAARLGIPLCVVRPVAVFGAGDPHNGYGPNRFARTALRDRAITLFGEGEEVREHIEVRDLARLLGLCLEGRASGALNAASGEPVSFLELAKHVARLCPHAVEIRRQPRAAGTAITHRRFNAARLRRMFPAFHCAPLDDGLARLLRELTLSASA